MNRFAASLAIASLCFSSAALAAPFDGSTPLICAVMETQLCSPGMTCDAHSAEDSDVPRFFKISVSGKKITGTRPSGAAIEASIENVRHSANMMFLQGAQDAFVWNVAIGEADGDMTMTVADSQNGMVIFGACTQP